MRELSAKSSLVRELSDPDMQAKAKADAKQARVIELKARAKKHGLG